MNELEDEMMQLQPDIVDVQRQPWRSGETLDTLYVSSKLLATTRTKCRRCGLNSRPWQLFLLQIFFSHSISVFTKIYKCSMGPPRQKSPTFSPCELGEQPSFRSTERSCWSLVWPGAHTEFLNF